MTCWESFRFRMKQKSLCRHQGFSFQRAHVESRSCCILRLANLVYLRLVHICSNTLATSVQTLSRWNVTACTSTFRHPSVAADVAVFTWRFLEKRFLFDVVSSAQLCLPLTYYVCNTKLFLNYYLLFFMKDNISILIFWKCFKSSYNFKCMYVYIHIIFYIFLLAGKKWILQRFI